jgi:uncharacterized membrane protein
VRPRWLQDSTTALRGLAALFGVLLLPATGWLCAEALGNRRAGCLGMVLVAVSPVHLLYAQEAREYSLWALMTVLSSAALLRAARVGSARAWCLVGVCTLLGLYSHGLFPLVMFAQAGWIVAVAAKREHSGDDRGRYLVGTYLGINLIALVPFAPWAWIVCKHLGRVDTCTSWMRESSAWGSHVHLWLNNLASVVVDGNFDECRLWGPALDTLRWLVVGLGIGSLVLTWRGPRRRAWLLAVALIVLPLAVLGVPDLLWGGQRSTQGRFLFPCYIGMTLATVHLLMPWLDSANRRARLVGAAALALLLILGTVTSATIWRADYWWNKGNGWDDQLQAIHTINVSERPLILSGPIDGGAMGHMLAFSHLLDGRVRLRVIHEGELPTLPPDFTDVFLANVSDAFVRQMGAERLGTRSQFWRCRIAPTTTALPPGVVIPLKE